MSLTTLRSLAPDEARACGAWVDEPAAEPLPGRWDPRPPPDQGYDDTDDVVSEDHEGLASTLHPDLLFELEPALWGVFDDWCLDGDRRPNPDRDSNFYTEALQTLQAAHARRPAHATTEPEPE